MSRYAFLVGGGFVVVLLACAEMAVRGGFVSPYMAPAPSQVALTLASMFSEGRVLAPLGQTLGLLLAGFTLACVLGIALGLAMGADERVYNLFDPLVEIIRPIPKPALIPPLMLFLGFGAEMKIVIITMAAFFPILINTIGGVKTIDPVVLQTARTFRVGPARTIFQVILPSATPMILAGARVALGLALVVAILGDMLASNGGLGFEIVDMQRAFMLPEMYAWVVVVSLLGLLQAFLFHRLESWLTFWARNNA